MSVPDYAFTRAASRRRLGTRTGSSSGAPLYLIVNEGLNEGVIQFFEILLSGRNPFWSVGYIDAARSRCRTRGSACCTTRTTHFGQGFSVAIKGGSDCSSTGLTSYDSAQYTVFNLVKLSYYTAQFVHFLGLNKLTRESMRRRPT